MKNLVIAVLVVACATARAFADDAAAARLNKVDAEVNRILAQIKTTSNGRYDLGKFELPTGVTPDAAGKAKVKACVDKGTLAKLADKLKEIGEDNIGFEAGTKTAPTGVQPVVSIPASQQIALLALDAMKRLAPSATAPEDSASSSMNEFLNDDGKGGKSLKETSKEGFLSKHFAHPSVEFGGTGMSGVDGKGLGSDVSVGVFTSKYVDVKGFVVDRQRMGGRIDHDSQDLGPAIVPDQDGNPVQVGEIFANSTIKAPPTAYRKWGSVEVKPFAGMDKDGKWGKIFNKHVKPFGEITMGTAQPKGPAWVDTTVGIVDPSGNFTPQQVIPTTAQPLDPADARKHFAATYGGGVTIPIAKGFEEKTHFGFAEPGGWKEISFGIQKNDVACTVKNLFKKTKEKCAD